jgi:hypothetical protein
MSKIMLIVENKFVATVPLVGVRIACHLAMKVVHF